MADDDAIIRATLREHGEPVSERGKVSAAHRERYLQLVGDGPGDTGPGDDYDGGVTTADFGTGGDDYDYGRDGYEHGAEDGETTAAAEETVPRGRRGRRSGGGGGGKGRRPAVPDVGRLWGRVKNAGKGAGKKHKWVSTADVIEHVWSQLAWSARPIPPVQKILAAQAPMAGMLLEDAVRGTWADRVILQPAARAESRLQAVNAMVGPPVWTTAIAMFGGSVLDPKTGKPAIDEDGNYVFDNRTAPMVGMLRFSLMSWLKVAEKQADEIMESAAELTRLSDEADKLIRWILAPPQPGQTPKDLERESAQRGREFVAAGQAEPPAAPGGFAGASQDQMTRVLEQVAGASAIRPVPVTGSRD